MPLAGLLPAIPAQAAGFDCAKAVSPTERTICADPVLSAADDALSAAYRAAWAVDLDHVTLRDDQLRWLAQRDRTTELEPLYRRRIAALQQIAEQWRALPAVAGLDALRHDCYTTPDHERDETCRVEASGEVAGRPSLAYQIQGVFDDDIRITGVALVFGRPADAAGPWRPVAATGDGGAHYQPPLLVRIAGRTILWIPGSLEGTGHFNAERLYEVGADGTLQDIDTDTWQRDFAGRLPEGLTALKGIYPDYATMTAETPLWAPGDANCCATGGRAAIRLALRGHALIIARLALRLGRGGAAE